MPLRHLAETEQAVPSFPMDKNLKNLAQPFIAEHSLWDAQMV
jgi:hypothetical protein